MVQINQGPSLGSSLLKLRAINLEIFGIPYVLHLSITSLFRRVGLG